MERKKRRANANLPHWPTSNSYEQEVVGESYYTENFDRLANWRQGADSVLLTMATLIPDPENKYDSNAIKVVVDGFHIGHLDRASALQYKDRVLDNPDIYDPPITTANIRIKRLLLEEKTVYSAALDLRLENPPSDHNKEPRRILRPVVLPYLTPYAYLQNGFLVILCHDQDKYTLSKAKPGDDLDVWQPEDSDKVFIYVRGSVGGGGKLADTNMQSLKAAGFDSLDDFNPVIHSVAGNLIIACAEIPRK